MIRDARSYCAFSRAVSPKAFSSSWRSRRLSPPRLNEKLLEPETDAASAVGVEGFRFAITSKAAPTTPTKATTLRSLWRLRIESPRCTYVLRSFFISCYVVTGYVQRTASCSYDYRGQRPCHQATMWRPLLPPVFSTNDISEIVILRSKLFAMSYTVTSATVT